MNRLDRHEWQKHNQRRIQEHLSRTFSGSKPDESEPQLEVEELPIQLRSTMKLNAIHTSSHLPAVGKLGASGLSVEQGPDTPPLPSDLDLVNTETIQVPVTRLRDFAQNPGQSTLEVCTTATYDVSVTSTIQGIHLLWSAIAQYQRSHKRTPSYIFVSEELLPIVLKDMDMLYHGAFRFEMPFLDESGQLTHIRVACDPSLSTYTIRCRE